MSQSPFDQQLLMLTLLNHVQDAIYFKDRESRFRLVNDALAPVFAVVGREPVKPAQPRVGRVHVQARDRRLSRLAHQVEVGVHDLGCAA